MSPLLLILASVFVGVIGQLLIKTGVNRIGPLVLKDHGIMPVAWRVGINPFIWSGLGLYALSTLFWVVALSRVELSYAYPFISLSYVLILLASWTLFHEEASLIRLFGVVSICLGIVVIARG